jgi:hypothetical protein
VWVVIEMEDRDDRSISKVIGPFDTHKAAREYLDKHGYHGAFEVRPLEDTNDAAPDVVP